MTSSIKFYTTISIFALQMISNYTYASYLTQSDLDRFSYWHNILNLNLNFSKCKMTTFTRSRSSLISKYFLHGNAIFCEVDCLIELGIEFSYDLEGSHQTHGVIRFLKLLVVSLVPCDYRITFIKNHWLKYFALDLNWSMML